MKTIGIIGAGVAGLHLGLYLLQRGVPCTIYAERGSAELRAGRLPSLAVQFGAMRARSQELGTNHWDALAPACGAIDVRVRGLPEICSRGRLRSPAISLDMRMVLARELEDFEERGGRVVVLGELGVEEIVALAHDHSLLVIATGRGERGELFPRILARSPWLEPQRRLFAGLFRGVRFPSEPAMVMQIIPGHGEIFETQVLGPEGPSTALLIEAIPGGALEPLSRIPHEHNPFAFEALLRDVLQQYAPEIAARLDLSAFELTGPNDSLQCAVLPTARRGYLALGNGCFAVAVGDAFAAYDPICAQGANVASRCAFELGRAITQRLAEDRVRPFDREFCEDLDARLWRIVEPSLAWTSAFLLPPSPPTMALLAAAARSSKVADAFAENYDDPAEQWRALKNAEGVRMFLATHGFGSGTYPSAARRAS